MRAFLGDFIDRIELRGAKGDRGRPRKVFIHGSSPGFTRIEVASLMSPSPNSWGWITRLGGLRERLLEAV
jgi:hypothetical protein